MCRMLLFTITTAEMRACKTLFCLVRLWFALALPGLVEGRPIQPVINDVQGFCHALHSSDQGERVQGVVCLELDQEETDILAFEIHVNTVGWELNEVFLWVGSNTADLPDSIEEGGADEHVQNFPFVQKRVKQRSFDFQVSLLDTLGYSCPNEATKYFASLHARIRSQDGHSYQNFTILKNENKSYSSVEGHNLIAFTLSCQELPHNYEGSTINQVDHIRSTVQKVHRLTQSCPSYPSTIAFNFTEADVQSLHTACVLNMLVNRCESGGMRKIIKNQQENYERFDGWADINDRALVAKTKDTRICYASIMGTEFFNPFDQLQNLNCKDTIMDGTDCLVRDGYLDAYNTSYKDAFRVEVDACVASCTGGCPLVLSGLSQGGGKLIPGVLLCLQCFLH